MAIQITYMYINIILHEYQSSILHLKLLFMIGCCCGLWIVVLLFRFISIYFNKLGYKLGIEYTFIHDFYLLKFFQSHSSMHAVQCMHFVRAVRRISVCNATTVSCIDMILIRNVDC